MKIPLLIYSYIQLRTNATATYDAIPDYLVDKMSINGDNLCFVSKKQSKTQRYSIYNHIKQRNADVKFCSSVQIAEIIVFCLFLSCLKAVFK